MNKLLVLLLVVCAAQSFEFNFMNNGDAGHRDFFDTATKPSRECMNDMDCPGSDLCNSRLNCVPMTKYYTCEQKLIDDCGFENRCIYGFCRYMQEPAFSDKEHAKSPPTCDSNKPCPKGFKCSKDNSCTRSETNNFAPEMKCTERWQCPVRMSCTNGFCT